MRASRPLGAIVENWSPPVRPGPARLDGTSVRLERLSASTHGAGLYAAFEGHDWVWDYMPVGPFADEAGFMAWVSEAEHSTDPLFYAIADAGCDRWCGVASYLRIKPASGAIEVGFIAMAPVLQRSRAATEAMHLMMAWAFDAGYRRYEWKCDALNTPSRRAAQRLGFSFEGVFAQATIVKGRNRDTAWFAVIDKDWPMLRAAHHLWLSPENFSETGEQQEGLTSLTRPVLRNTDPFLDAGAGD